MSVLEQVRVKAKVKNGHLVIIADKPTNLPEGTVVDLVAVEKEDPYAHLDADDELDDAGRAELHASLDRAMEQHKAGLGRPMKEFLEELKQAQ